MYGDVRRLIWYLRRGRVCVQIGAVAYVVAQVMGKPVEQVVQAAWENTVKVFFPHRKDWL